jgi:RNA polymerase sigma-70 factor (ECF subfamily)
VEVSDSDLVARVVADDDRRAFAALVRRHHALVRALLRKLACGDAALADDLAQETFLRAYRALAGFEGRAKLSTWLCQIAYRTFLAEAERAGRAERAQQAERAGRSDDGAGAAPAEASAAPGDAAGALLRHDVERALARLDVRERHAIALTFGQDLTHDDAARILGLPLGTLKTTVARGLEKLERHLRAWQDERTA